MTAHHEWQIEGCVVEHVLRHDSGCSVHCAEVDSDACVPEKVQRIAGGVVHQILSCE